MRKLFLWLGVASLVLVLVVLASVFYRFRDRNPGYELDLVIEGGRSAPLKVGFAAVPITPEIPDLWTDLDENARYSESDGDTFVDGNGNGRFDPVWIAGFGNARAANGVNDDLWARAVVFDDSSTRIALVAVDAIGFFHDDVADVRERIPASSGVTYTVIASTHVHEAPDLMGLWGPSHFSTGVDADYLEFVKTQIVRSVVEAASNLTRARLRIAEDPVGAIPLVMDSRLPAVMDPGLRIIQALEQKTGQTLGTLISWANHPETTWSRNLLISSDFPHYLREAVETGIQSEGADPVPGLGGVALFFNGAIGGLMTTDDEFPVEDPFSGESFREPSFAKARAQGHQLALLVLKALESEEVYEMERGAIKLRAKTIVLPLENPIFKLGIGLGVIDRGFTGWMKLRTEVAAFTLGEMSFVCLPGEIYPEIVNGGIEASPGQDFDLEPVEVPPLRDKMPGRYRFVLGMANDEIGYIIPKSEWDEVSPFLYGAEKSPYGEINSVGPETGPIIHRAVLELLAEFE